MGACGYISGWASRKEGPNSDTGYDRSVIVAFAVSGCVVYTGDRFPAVLRVFSVSVIAIPFQYLPRPVDVSMLLSLYKPV